MKVEGKKDPVEQTPGEGEEFLKGFKTSFDYVSRFVINDRQTTIQSLGTEIVDFKRTDVIELSDPAKNRIRFYIERETHLPVKMQVRRSDDAKIREEQYANWHKFQGVNDASFRQPLYGWCEDDGDSRRNRGLQFRSLRQPFYPAQPVEINHHEPFDPRDDDYLCPPKKHSCHCQ